MSRAVDIEKELSKLTFLDGRTRETTQEEEDAAFAVLAKYRDGGVFAGGFAGESPWERHPEGDELVHVLKGSARLTIMTTEGPEVSELRAGMVIVVPKGRWHRFDAPEGVTVLTVTPEPTEHTAVDDPRTVGLAPFEYI